MSVPLIKAQKFEPSKETIAKQLNEPANRDLQSKVLNKVVQIWEKAETDIARLGTLVVNGHTIQSGERSPTSADVFDVLILSTGGDIETARKIANLLQQEMIHFMHRTVYGESINTKGIKEIDTFNEVEVFNDDSFKITREGIFGTLDYTDPTNPSKRNFFKAKLIIEGNVKDLKQGNVEELAVYILTTRERHDIEDVRHEWYPLRTFLNMGTHF